MILFRFLLQNFKLNPNWIRIDIKLIVYLRNVQTDYMLGLVLLNSLPFRFSQPEELWEKIWNNEDQSNKTESKRKHEKVILKKLIVQKRMGRKLRRRKIKAVKDFLKDKGRSVLNRGNVSRVSRRRRLPQEMGKCSS